jgi:alpha-D-xyloside xylohydrolase
VVLPLDADEPIHGFGESFGGADASGQVREAQFRVALDSESGLNEAHAPVPLAMWPRRGVGLFVEDRRTGAFDLGAARPGSALTTFGPTSAGALPIQIFVDDDPVDLVRTYVGLTGKPAVPPRWAFAPQQWRNEWASSDEVRADLTAMRDLDIPGSVMWIDNPWQTAYNTFVVDEQRLAGFDALMDELAAQGYRVVFWSTPYLQNEGLTQEDYVTARENGWLVRDSSGAVLDLPWKEGPVGLVDFTNPDAVAFWRERIARIVERGASGFKLDYGEDVVPELGGTLIAMQLAGGTNAELHGIFARAYHDAYLGALPDGDGWLITRAGAWGEQDRNPTIWPGDLDSDFSRHGVDNGEGMTNVGGLPAAIAGGLSLSVSGYPFYGSDIGGYREGPPTTEALLRWAAYASLGTIMQLGGGGPSHNPWDTTLFDADAAAIYRGFARLHMDLNPYLWTLAQRAGEDGTPITRPCRFVYPDADCDDAMFLLGDGLLVAPVIEPGATTRTANLPTGDWIDWWTGEIVYGPTTVTVPAPLDRIPMWIGVGAGIPMFARAADTLEPATATGVTSYTDPAYARELRVVGVVSSVTTHDGATLDCAVVLDTTYIDCAFTPGSQYDIVTLEWPGRGHAPTTVTAPDALPEVTDDAALAACADGCWRYDDATGRLKIRVTAITGTMRSIQFD